MLRRKAFDVVRQGLLAARQSEACAARSVDRLAAVPLFCQRLQLDKLEPEGCAAMSTNSHDHFNQHQSSPENNADTPFDFTDESYELAAEIMSHYPRNYKASAVIPLLTLAQNQNKGWLPLSAMNKVAEILGMAPIRVYEVATFYTMFNRSKMGRYHIMVCGTTPCMLCGSRSVYQAIRDYLGVEYGQTTADGYFTFSEMECMGACANAPMICVADYTKGVDGFTYIYYEDLSPKDAVDILEELKAGKAPRRGSQYRNKAEPMGTSSTGEWIPTTQGATTLTFDSLGGNPPGPFCRDLDEPVPEGQPGQPAGPAPPTTNNPPPPPPKSPPRG